MRLPLLTLSLLASSVLGLPPLQSPAAQIVLSGTEDLYVVDDAILSALAQHSDPVEALLSLQPELRDYLAEPRLLDVFGQGEVWLTEGDKLRLRREGKKFGDVTDFQAVTTSLTGAMACERLDPTLSEDWLTVLMSSYHLAIPESCRPP